MTQVTALSCCRFSTLTASHQQLAYLFTGRAELVRGSRGTLQVYSAAAEAVKVYEKEYRLGQRHNLKVRLSLDKPPCLFVSMVHISCAATADRIKRRSCSTQN